MRRAFPVVVAGLVVLVALAGCGRLRDRASAADTTDMSWPAQALQAVGFSTNDLAAADPADGGASAAPGATAGARRRHPLLRYVFQHALHGEATVQTDEGTRTVVAQRGKVTALTATSITVVSTDGYTLTWTANGQTVVVVNRTRSQLDAVSVGSEIGVAGARSGDAVTARLVVVPKK